MITFDQLLAMYAPAIPDFQLKSSLVDLLKKGHKVKVESEPMKLTDHISFIISDVERQRNRTHRNSASAFYLHIADKKLYRESELRMLAPLEEIPLCNYMWHALKLNLAAYLTGYKVSRLLLVHCYDNAQLHEVRYNPGLIQGLLSDYQAKHLTASIPAPVNNFRYVQKTML